MTRLITRRQFGRTAILSALGLNSFGCGTILYPERKGQPAGPLDWKVVAFDAVGLLFFFVPGVIAFAVDFNNGTIYLPAEEYGDVSQPRPGRQLVSVDVPASELTQSTLERFVSKHVDGRVRLVAGQYRTQELSSLDEFWTTHDAEVRSGTS